MSPYLINILSTYSLFVLFAVGATSAYFANREGKNPYLWFALGILLGVFAIGILFFLKYQEKHKKSLQQKQKPSPKPIKDSRFWYYLDEKNAKFGPISFFKLQSLLHEKKISPDTYVWTETFENWKLLKEIKEYKKFLQKNIPSKNFK
jgi:hypothetical protein